MQTENIRICLARVSYIVVAVFLAGAVSVMPVTAAADDDNQPEPGDPTSVWAISIGGQLYDKWWAVLEHDTPTDTHAAYPAAGKKSGADTWRCKECHGWDYKGKDGAYSKGSHFTGIKGVREMVGKDPKEIIAIVRGEPHGYTEELIPGKAIEKLALFISLGQVDMDVYIDRATKKARGDENRGGKYYQTICANCHGYDGKELNFKDADNPEYIGTVAQDNPWETLHKIRMGQPGVPMVALSVLDIQDLVDILAYTQTLPAK